MRKDQIIGLTLLFVLASFCVGFSLGVYACHKSVHPQSEQH